MDIEIEEILLDQNLPWLYKGVQITTKIASHVSNIRSIRSTQTKNKILKRQYLNQEFIELIHLKDLVEEYTGIKEETNVEI